MWPDSQNHTRDTYSTIIIGISLSTLGTQCCCISARNTFSYQNQSLVGLYLRSTRVQSQTKATLFKKMWNWNGVLLLNFEHDDLTAEHCYFGCSRSPEVNGIKFLIKMTRLQNAKMEENVLKNSSCTYVCHTWSIAFYWPS